MAASQSMSIGSVLRSYERGERSPTEFIDEVLERCDTCSISGIWITQLSRGQVHAQIERAEARRSEGIAQPLFGVPFAVKDNIDVASIPTTAACPAYAYAPERSAFVVQRLCDAGAIVIGKTNMDQFATGLVGTRSPYGACENVFDPRYISGGSSAGSAVAVAAGLASFSLGTDTAGSGRVPAAFNNLVGLKPTRGKLSTSGVVPACRSLDCVSIFAGTCDDARLVLDVAAGFDEEDPYSRRPARHEEVQATRLRVGVPAGETLEFFGDAEARALFERAVQRLGEIGAEVVTINLTPFRKAAELLYAGPWVAERVAAVGDFCRAHPEACLPVLRTILSGGERLSAVDAFKGFYALEALKRETEREWEKMDVLLTPTTGTIYTIADVMADPLALNTNLGYYTNFVNLLDLSAISVPSGFRSNGLPTGVTFVSHAWREATLLDIGGRFHVRIRGGES